MSRREYATGPDAVTAAAPPPAAAKQRTDRFLQQRSFVHAAPGFVAADKGFVAEQPAKIEVRIGLPEEGLDHGREAMLCQGRRERQAYWAERTMVSSLPRCVAAVVHWPWKYSTTLWTKERGHRMPLRSSVQEA